MSIATRDKDGSKQKKIKEICIAIGYESECLSECLDAVIDKAYELLILNKNSSPASDNKSEHCRKDPDYDRYLLDIAPFDITKLKPEEPKAPQVIGRPVFENECPYRSIVVGNKGFEVYCDTKKIPAEVCLTRQKRYLHFNRNCYPETKKLRRPRQPVPLRQGSTHFSMGDSEGVEPNWHEGYW